jgi:NAD+ synthase
MKPIKLPYINPGVAAAEIGHFIADRAQRFGTGGVIGLSGGVDSTLAAALAKQGFDHYNAAQNANLELVAYMLPSKVNPKTDEEDGIKVAERLKIRYEVLSIQPIVEAYRHTNPEAFSAHYHEGNLMSRIRANILNTKSATEKKPVIGTGNKDEDFGIGYYTLFGDGAVHFSPIGGLSKRLVCELASYMGFEGIASKAPAAGLEPEQTDFKDLGYRYDAVEIVTEGLSQGFTPFELYTHPQVEAIVRPQLRASKHRSIEQVVEDIVRRHRIAISKAKLIHPEIAPVSLEYR